MARVPSTKTRPVHQLVGYLWINIRAFYFRLFESFRIFCRYYRNLPFAAADILLCSSYFFKSPYQVKGYGETPLTTLAKIAKKCRILSHDTVIELGSGTARGCFWLSSFVKCRVIGIDRQAFFIKKANRVKELTKNSRVHFREEDYFTASLDEATVIYLYGTDLEDDLIVRLCKRLAELPGRRIITVSYPLADYDDRFETVQQFRGSFPWGKTSLYLNELKPLRLHADT